MKVVQAAAEARLADPKVNDLDVWALVIRSGVRPLRLTRMYLNCGYSYRLFGRLAQNLGFAQCPYSAHTVPIQCPYSAHTVPIMNSHSAHTFLFTKSNYPYSIF